jgi:hypothetical protein
MSNNPEQAASRSPDPTRSLTQFDSARFTSTKRFYATPSQPPMKMIQLNRSAAAQWLVCVNQCLLSNFGAQCVDLATLRNSLEDACWLARWKREDVLLELCPSLLAGVVATLIRIHSDDSIQHVSEVLEGINQQLSSRTDPTCQP